MVVALGPGRFYGGGLPRPRVFPGDRVDPPAPVTDALLCWARDAHWSMGGLGAKRLRLQGRIEGNLVKLRRTARHDARVSAKSAKSKVRAAGQRPAAATLDDALGSDDDDSEDEADVAAQERALRREVVDDDEDSESGESEGEGEGVPLVTIAAAAKRKRVRKLSDEFDRFAAVQQEDGGRKKPAAVAPAKAQLRKKAAAPAVAAPAPAAEAPAKKSLKRKAAAVAAGAAARTSPKRKAAEAAAAKTPPKRKSAEAPAARRTSPRSKH